MIISLVFQTNLKALNDLPDNSFRSRQHKGMEASQSKFSKLTMRLVIALKAFGFNALTHFNLNDIVTFK